MSKEITKELTEKVLRLLNEGSSPSSIKDVISQDTGFRKTKSNDIYNDILKGIVFDNDIFDFDLQSDDPADKPYFNEELKKYIVYIKPIGRNIVVSESTHNKILELYSDWNGESSTINEICRAIQWPRQIFTSYIKAFGVTKDSLPISEADFIKYDDDELTARLIELRKFTIHQKFEKQDWDATRSAAQKWRAFEYKELNPFTEMLKSWQPPVLNKIDFPAAQVSNKTLVIGLSDLHWGSASKIRDMYNDKGGWDSNKTSKVVKNYCKGILQAASERNYKFDKVVILFLGDFLHSISGKTGRGTELKYDIIREDQFEYALNSLVEFVGHIAANFPKVLVHTVCGNHAYEVELGLYRAVDMAFRTQDNVEFSHYSSRPAPFLVDSTLFLMDHGQDSGEKVGVPTKEPMMKSHVNSLLVKQPKLVSQAKTILFVQGDKHVFKHIEFDNFEFIMFGTSIGADEHADRNNWGNRARQSCLVLDDTGLKEVLHFFTDELIK